VNVEALAHWGADAPKRKIMEKVFEANVNIMEYSSHVVQLFFLNKGKFLDVFKTHWFQKSKQNTLWKANFFVLKQLLNR